VDVVHEADLELQLGPRRLMPTTAVSKSALWFVVSMTFRVSCGGVMSRSSATSVPIQLDDRTLRGDRVGNSHVTSYVSRSGYFLAARAALMRSSID
jgi:hypothetical protein